MSKWMKSGKARKETDIMRKKLQFLASSVMIVTGLCIMPIFAFADNGKAKLIETTICDWSYDYIFYTEDFFYDENGRLAFCGEKWYGDEQSLLVESGMAWEESEGYGIGKTYDYYDNRNLRMISGIGWEEHYDQYGMLMDSPKPAVPNPAYCIWYYNTVEHTFDTNGNLTRLKADDIVYEYNYDSKGRVLEVRSSDPDDYFLCFTYLQNGGYTLRGEKNTDWGGYESYEEEYDGDGQILRRTCSDEDSFSETIHEYSSDDSIEKIYEYADTGEGKELRKTSEIKRFYDSRGLLQREEEWEIIEGENKLQKRTEYAYDWEGNMIHLQMFQYFYDSYSYGRPILMREERHIYRAE